MSNPSRNPWRLIVAYYIKNYFPEHLKWWFKNAIIIIIIKKTRTTVRAYFFEMYFQHNISRFQEDLLFHCKPQPPWNTDTAPPARQGFVKNQSIRATLRFAFRYQFKKGAYYKVYVRTIMACYYNNIWIIFPHITNRHFVIFVRYGSRHIWLHQKNRPKGPNYNSEDQNQNVHSHGPGETLHAPGTNRIFQNHIVQRQPRRVIARGQL